MNEIGKKLTWLLAITIFIVGLLILFTQDDIKMDKYLDLCKFVSPLIGIPMIGIATKSIIKENKGNKENE
jgi:SNF family Na+-dependent transporter